MLLPLLLQAALLAAPPQDKLRDEPFGDAFWKTWGDGHAELSGYQLSMPRYGKPRTGTAVTVFVTETFSGRSRVKALADSTDKRDEYPVLKLNLMQDFATGIYDYNLMTSAFVALSPAHGRPAGSPSKLSFSSQEWCGQVFAQALFDDKSLRLQSNSYFDGEGDESRTLSAPTDSIAEDALLLWARGLAAPAIAAGQELRVPCLLSLERARLQHFPTALGNARLARAKDPERVRVPAGEFLVEWATATIDNGPVWRFAVESQAPRRIIVWEANDGRRAELLGSQRLRYWELNGPGGENALSRLGLLPRPARTP